MYIVVIPQLDDLNSFFLCHVFFRLGSFKDGSNNIFSNDGSFMNQFKKLLEKQRQDKDEKERVDREKEKAASEQLWREKEQHESEERSAKNNRETRWGQDEEPK